MSGNQISPLTRDNMAPSLTNEDMLFNKISMPDRKTNMARGKGGTMTYASGDKYEGEFKYDKRHGKGVYTSASGFKYDGDWKDDKQHGKGVMTYASGSKYEGEFKDDKRHGKGVRTYASGEKYEGEFKDDNLHITKNDFVQKANDRPTIVLRSIAMKNSEGKMGWGDGDRLIDQFFVSDAQQALDKLKEWHEKKKDAGFDMSEIRIVFDQHGNKRGFNELGITSEIAEKMLNVCGDAKEKCDIVVSDLACDGGTAYHFEQIVQGFVDKQAKSPQSNFTTQVGIRRAEEGKIIVMGYKENANGDKKATAIMLDESGVAQSRRKTTYRAQSSQGEIQR